MAKRRTAAEIIGFHFSCDIRDVQDGRYQPTRYANPAIYVIGNDYYAAPSSNQPPRYQDIGGQWEAVAEYYGRTIYRSEAT